MNNKVNAQRVLDYFNQATVSQIAGTMDQNGKEIGEILAKKIVNARGKNKSGRFSSLKAVQAIEGISMTKLDALMNAISAPAPKSGLVKSRTLLSFAGRLPDLKEYNGKVRLVEKPTFEFAKDQTAEELKEKKYYLYYDPELDRDQVIKVLSNHRSYRNSGSDLLFAIQTMNGKFVSVSISGQVGFSNNILDREVFEHSMYLINHITPAGVQGWSQLYNFLAVTIKLKGLDYLYYDYTTGKISYGPFNSQAANSPFHFDIYGALGKPTWAPDDLFKAFTLMNYYKEDVSVVDPRKFISQETNDLKGTNLIGWLPKNWFRYVDVVENVSLKSKTPLSSTGRTCLSTSQAGATSFEDFPTAQPIPARGLFDMYCMYGFWDDRKNISAKVVFRSKLNGKFLSVNSNDIVSCGQIAHGPNEMFLVEDGWGGRADDVVLKTSFGKYLYAYQGYAKADTVVPINFEQFEIIYP